MHILCRVVRLTFNPDKGRLAIPMGKLSSIVQNIANTTTIGAFGIATYAFIWPETVSDYLRRIDESSNETADNTREIANNTEAIAQINEGISRATSRLEAAIPTGPEVYFYVNGDSCPDECETDINILNMTPDDIHEVSLILADKGAENQFSYNFGSIFRQTSSGFEEAIGFMPSHFCLFFSVEGDDRLIAEYREVTYPLIIKAYSTQPTFGRRVITNASDSSYCSNKS